MEEKTKGRKRHIVVDTMGNLLAVVVYAANIHDTKAGIWAAKKAFETYPSIQRFCADTGYRKTFEQVVSSELGLGVDISARIKPVWEGLPKGGSESVLWCGSTTPAGGFHPAAGGSLRPLYLIQLLDGEAQLCHHILLGRIAVKAVVVGGNINTVVRTDVAIVIFDM